MSVLTSRLHPATPLEEGLGGLWLRERTGDDVAPWRPVDLTLRPAGEADGLRWTWRRADVPDRPGWSVEVLVINERATAVEVDLLTIEDLALSQPEVLAANRLYPSQYLDLTPVDLGERGVAVAVRQNMPGPAAPWAMLAAHTPATGWATDALQVMGVGLPEGHPWPGLARDLPSERLQHEHAAAILQTAPARLAPGERWRSGFFVLLLDDHPAATSQADAALADGVVPSGDLDHAEPVPEPASLVGRSCPPLPTRPLTHDEAAALIPGDRLHVERIDGADAAWFTPDGAHLVTSAKQAAVLRPHGQVLRPLTGLLPGDRDVTATVWMDGGFCSHLTRGHAALGRILSSRDTPLGIGRLRGLRILVDDGSGPRLLGTPSAWLSAVDGATWWYATAERVLRVHTTAPAADGTVEIAVDTLAGDPVPALVVLALDWSGAPGDLGALAAGDDGCTIEAPAASLLAGTRLDVRTPPGARIGDDSPLFADGAGRDTPTITVAVDPQPAWRLTLTPTGGEASPDAAPSDWSGVHGVVAASTPAGGEEGALLARVDQATGWFAHDALVHYLSPRGLEQHTGGAWGTRDVAQGPVGLLRAWGEHDAWRALLLRVFRAQHERGDWPQAFDFLPDFRRDVVADSHGDVVYWPLLALGQYLAATGDHGMLDERVAFTGDGRPGAEADVAGHVASALDAIEATFVAGRALPAYGHGDWNDSLQPANPDLARRMVSTWTSALQSEALGVLADGLRPVRPDLAERAAGIAERGEADLREVLLVDGVLAGYGVLDGDGFTPLIHPRDRSTGLTYSVLAMIHAIAGDLLTPEEAASHLALIGEHLTGPDGVRLFDRPVAYRGGPMEIFQRAEASSFFGREIGLMYMHAHLRYAEALARVGDGKGMLAALALAVPVGIADQVPTAAPRQSNTYASSSDAGFADRYQAAERYADIASGAVRLEGGWRVYSSGPGLFLEVLTQRMLGIRHAAERIEIDPVLDPALGSVRASLPVLGRALRVEFVTGPLGHGVASVEADGKALAATPLENRYRDPGVSVASDDVAGATVLRVVTR